MVFIFRRPILHMGYFSDLRQKESRFYRRMWQELEHVKVIDTHEHLSPMPILLSDMGKKAKDDRPLVLPKIFRSSYVKGLSLNGDYKQWAEELKQFRGTGYLQAWLIAIEDLYDLSPPVTPGYLKKMEQSINEAYRDDLQNTSYNHMKDVLSKMNVEYLINNIGIDEQIGRAHV